MIQRGVLSAMVLIMILCCTMTAAEVEPQEQHADTDTRTDVLSDIQSRGTLVVAVDPDDIVSLNEVLEPVETDYGTLPQYSLDQVPGYGTDIIAEIAKELGVDVVFVTPPYEEITAGNWSDRWDLYTNFYITDERLDKFYFTEAIESSPSLFYVRTNETEISKPGDLSGKTVGVLKFSAQADYMNNTLDMPGILNENPVKDAIIVTYDDESRRLSDLESGKLDAALFSRSWGEEKITEGHSIQPLYPEAFWGYGAFAVDKAGSRNPVSFVKTLNEIIMNMHETGELSRLSMEYYKEDVTNGVDQLDYASLNQFSENGL